MNTPHFKLYAIPHDCVTDLYRDREMKQYYGTDLSCQYRKSKCRVINGIYHFVEIIK